MLDSEKISAKKAEQLMLERESALAGSSQASTIRSQSIHALWFITADAK